jgi:type II secretory pathway pseudopilin PulG
MAALLVSMAVMAVLMTVAMPAYRHLARREKETELVFRGEQYARAIALYRAKNGNNFPPSIDVLVQGKYLRKKYKDPMTKDGEFRLVPVGNPQGTPQGGNPQGGPGQPPAGGRGPGGAQTPPAGAPPGVGRGPQPQTPAGQPGSFISGGIMGVASKSQETSIRIYKGQTRYDMWPFTFNMVNRPGGQPGPGQPGGPGAQQPGVGPGGRGPGGRGPGGRGPGGPGRGMGPGRGGERGFGPGRGDSSIQIPGRGGRGPGL